jgi:hypothetical protein
VLTAITFLNSINQFDICNGEVLCFLLGMDYILNNIIMLSLHDVCGIKTHKAGLISLLVRMLQF